MICVSHKKPYNESLFFYLAICVMFLVRFISMYGHINIEPIDMGSIKRILHPEYPQGGVMYDPQFHYNYIVAFVAKIFGYEANSPGLATIFWFLEQALTLVVLVKLCDFLFRSDKIALVLVIFAYLMLKSGETDQKTMVRPLHFLAIYYFLKEKWLLSAIFAASLFYLHIGIAIWWFLPSCFALGIMFLLKNKRVTLTEIAKYSFTAVLLASPVLYFYMSAAQNAVVGDFITKYFCGTNNSVLLLLSDQHTTLIMILITVAVFVVGYSKWRKAGGANECIVPIALGVLTLYTLDFVLADLMFNGVAIRLQLLRSILNVELFASLFFAFLIARQVRRGNYIFFFMLLLLFIPNPFRRIFFVIDKWSAVYTFYSIVVVYEIFQSPISNFAGKISEYFKNKITISRPGKLVDIVHRFFQEPVKLAGFIIVLMIAPQIAAFTPIKSFVKSALRISSKEGVVKKGVSKRESLYEDIIKFTNERIKNNDAILVIPFYEGDFEYYTRQKVFIHEASVMHYIPVQIDKFQHIFENDLNYSIEKLREGGSWEDIWRGVDEGLILKWKKEYGITHVIREKDLPLNCPVIYKNEHYVVYKL